jgi:signal transduction histidine kinase
LSDRLRQAPTLRLLVGVALLGLGFAEVQSIVLSLRAHGRLRDRAVTEARRAMMVGHGQLEALLAPRDRSAYELAAVEARNRLGVSETEILDPNGHLVFSSPGPAPVVHELSPEDRRRVMASEILVFGPLHGEGMRVLVYAMVHGGGAPMILRLATGVPDVVEDLRERDRLFLVQAGALFVLLLAAALAVVPPSRASSESPAVIDAYEHAMGRLRDRGEELIRAHDIEKQRLALRMQEREALARAGELTAGIAHEVRNGLGTIVGYARLIERDQASPLVTDAARNIREECEALGNVVRRFVDYVKNEDLVVARFDFDRMVSRVVGREKRDGSAEIHGPEGEAGVVSGDEDMLEAAVENLVRNAREAAGPRGHVRVRVERSPDAVRIAVIDDGPGVPEPMRDEIRPFFTTKPTGLGLGLPTVKKIARLHGGDLVLRSPAAGGTIALLSVPVVTRLDDRDATDRNV